MNLEFFVSNRKLTRKGMSTLVADTAACDTFTIDFDSEWDGLVKLVELQNGGDTAQVLYTGKTPLPKQVCGRGELYLVCHGYRKKGDSVAVVRTIPMTRPVKMVGSAPIQGSTAQPYTPSAFEQMAAQTADARQAAQEARQAVQELLALKEAGAFTGPPGPGGLSATVQVESVREGAPARVENLGTERNARLRFTLPYQYVLTDGDRQAIAELALGDIAAAMDAIVAIQEALIAGGEVSG